MRSEVAPRTPSRRAGSAVVFLAVLASACSTVRVTVPVVRPAEVDLHGKRELVVGAIQGEQGPAFASALKSAIAGTGYFKLIDRTHLDAVLSELRLSVSDLADEGARAKLGRLLTGSILVAGAIDRYEYAENIDKTRSTCSRNESGKVVEYECWSYERRGKVDVVAAFDVVDIATGENLRAKRLQCERPVSTAAMDQVPASIDPRPLFDACAEEVIASFVKAIAPWTDHEEVEFSKDGDLPGLEVGIRHAKIGQWPEAIDAFERAIAHADTLPSLSVESRAKAHRNLGLAFAYSGQFEKATEQLNKAFAMAGDDADLQKIQHVRRLESERRTLEAQLSSTQGAP